MIEWTAALWALAAMVLLALAGWGLSVRLVNAAVVDSLWSIFFLLGASVYAASAGIDSARHWLLLVLVTLWALRLSGYLTWRNWAKPEDRRYQEIRARNEPGFAWKSVYLVFGLQAALAWVIAMPLFATLSADQPLRVLDLIGIALWITGFVFEAIADAQLTRFKADRSNGARVLMTGLWRYTRHPNYFGEALLWWGYFAIATAAGGAWTAFSPILMTVLLVRVSGVALLEKDIGERRPEYRDYIARTNAFIPGRPRKGP